MINPFITLIGQDFAVQLLKRAVATDRIAPAYLFVGATGIGKGYGAMCFAEKLLIAEGENYSTASAKIKGGNHPDFLWVEPTYLHQGQLYTAKQAEEIGLKRRNNPQIRIEQVRQISQFLSRPPLKADRSIVIIDSAELMAESAGNALLKTLEEPGKATIILIAPNTNSILTTLVSRCQIIPFNRLSEKHLKLVLYKKDAGEILDYPQLINLAQGCPGKAIADFQQLQEIPTDLLKQLQKPTEDLITGFTLSQEITNNLEVDTQIWLADYLQSCYWEKKSDLSNSTIIENLEKVKRALKRYVQPRLVWDCFFLSENKSVNLG